MAWCGFKVGQQNRSGATIPIPSDCLGLSPFKPIRFQGRCYGGWHLSCSFLAGESDPELPFPRIESTKRLNACVFSSVIVVSHCAGRFGVGRRGLRCRLGADTEVSREPKG